MGKSGAVYFSFWLGFVKAGLYLLLIDLIFILKKILNEIQVIKSLKQKYLIVNGFLEILFLDNFI